MKRPLFPCITGLVLGEAVAIVFGFKGILFPVMLFLLAGLYGKLWQRLHSRFFCNRKENSYKRYEVRRFMIRSLLFSVFVLLGFGLFLHAQKEKAPLIGKKLPIEGIIRGNIAFLKNKEDGNYEIVLKDVWFLEQEKKQTGKESKGRNGKFAASVWQKIRGDCRVSLLIKTEENLMPEDELSCEGELEDLSVPTNPGEFHSDIYYRSKGITCQFFAYSVQIKEKEKGISVAGLSYRARTALASVYNRVLGPDYAALLHAMVLGDKGMLDEGQKRRYEENGVAHLLSVSGLHVSVVAGSWFRFLRKRKFSYTLACLGGFFLLIFYGCMTGFGNSIIRAIIMYGTYLGAEYFGVCYDMTSAMSLAGIGMLLTSPWRILEGGCQMSFSAIFAIGYVLPWIKELEQKRKSQRKKEKEYRWWKSKGQEALLSSIVISAVTMPVILRVFFTFSPYSVWMNLIVIPCMMPVMISGILGGISGILLHSFLFGEVVTKCLFLPAVCVLRGFDFFLEHMRQLPGAVWTAGCPSFAEMLLLYALEGGIVFLWYKRWWNKGLCCFLLIICWMLALPSNATLRIMMLDVGQGDAILIQMPNGESVLIDGGSTSRSQVGKYILLPALRYHGIGKLDYVIATHMDADHISGIEELLGMNYPVRQLLLPAGQKDHDMERLETKAEKAGTQVIYMNRGDTVQFHDTFLRCLHPFSNFKTEDKNAGSLVFHLQYGKFDVLFTGDLEKSGEEALCQYLNQKEKRRWEVLKVAHHGSKYSTGQAFLNQVSPAAALLSAGKGNRYGHPHKEVLERLRKRGADLYLTMEKGAVLVEVRKTSWSIASWQNKWSQWKKTRL